MASIRKISDFTHQITVSDGYDSKGKKIRKFKTVELDSKLTPKQIEKELQRIAVEFESEVKRGTHLDGSKITFAEFCEKWLKDYAETQLERRTIANYREMLTKRIIPALGHLKLDKIQPHHLLEFYNNLAEGGMRLDYKYTANKEFVKLMKSKTYQEVSDLSKVQPETISNIVKGKSCISATVNKICEALQIKRDKYFEAIDGDKPLSSARILHHHKTISTVLTAAVQWQLIMSNPTDRVKPPKLEKKEAKAYDEDMAEKMLSLIENEHVKYRLVVHTVIFTGCRLAELSGLEWSDIDMENNNLRIRQSSQYLPGEGIFVKGTKSESGYRIIAVPEILIDLFREYKVWQNEERLKLGDLWQDNDRIFTKWNGDPIFPATPSRWFRQIRVKYGLPDLKFHELRHTNASLLIAQGVDVRTVSKRLGHARTSITTDIYAHALKRPDKEAAEKLDTLLNKKKKESNAKKANEAK